MMSKKYSNREIDEMFDISFMIHCILLFTIIVSSVYLITDYTFEHIVLIGLIACGVTAVLIIPFMGILIAIYTGIHFIIYKTYKPQNELFKFLLLDWD